MLSEAVLYEAYGATNIESPRGPTTGLRAEIVDELDSASLNTYIL